MDSQRFGPISVKRPMQTDDKIAICHRHDLTLAAFQLVSGGFHVLQVSFSAGSHQLQLSGAHHLPNVGFPCSFELQELHAL